MAEEFVAERGWRIHRAVRDVCGYRKLRNEQIVLLVPSAVLVWGKLDGHKEQRADLRPDVRATGCHSMIAVFRLTL